MAFHLHIDRGNMYMPFHLHTLTEVTFICLST